jgi:hypothetical protein
MSQPSALDELVDALRAAPPYDNPLTPLYEAFGRRPISLADVRQQSDLLRQLANQAQEETFAVNKAILSCQQIPPTPLPVLILGF